MMETFLVEDYRDFKNDKKYLYLIIYDIIDDRKRNQLFKFLKSYGKPVQKSSFECYLTLKQYSKIESYVYRLINPTEDNVRAYQLNGLNKVFNYGITNPNSYEDVLIL